MDSRIEELESRVTFTCGGQTIVGKLAVPRGLRTGERRSAFVVLPGFGGNKDAAQSKTAAELFAQLGYVTLRIDYRGCGESEGVRGLVVCENLVADALASMDFLACRPEVDMSRIGLFGASLGGAAAIQVAGTDKRVAACISSGGWGNGETKLRWQHKGSEAWQRFTTMMEEGRRRRALGEMMMVHRFDIVPIPPSERGKLMANAIMEFPFDVVESEYAFRPVDVVGAIAPRPLLLLHAANDPVTPTEQSIDLFQHAGQPTDLHLIADVGHFMAENTWLVLDIMKNWLHKYFPTTKEAS